MIKRLGALATGLAIALAMPAVAQVEVPSSAFPFESRFQEVEGARLHYVEEGEGDPILFLHGNPTSVYLWRNVMPFVSGQGRAIALDLVGFGKSEKVAGAYSFQDHYRYLEGFVDAMDLQDMTLVVHDWGSVLGLLYAARHPDRVKAVAFMEAIVPPVFPMPDLSAMGPYEETFRAFRDPVAGPQLIVDQNVFIEQLLPASVLRPLSEEEMAAYRAPFLDPAHRQPILVWPNELPIAGEPARNLAVVEEIGQWLMTAEQPKLLLYASPGAIVPPEAAAWMAAHYKNLQTRFVGNGVHFLQEDEPEAIGRNLSDWLRDVVRPAS